MIHHIALCCIHSNANSRSPHSFIHSVCVCVYACVCLCVCMCVCVVCVPIHMHMYMYVLLQINKHSETTIYIYIYIYIYIRNNSTEIMHAKSSFMLHFFTYQERRTSAKFSPHPMTLLFLSHQLLCQY